MTPTEPTTPVPDSWKAEESEAIGGGGKGRLLLLVIGGVIVVLLVAGGAFLFFNNGDDVERAWPPAVNGRPAGLGEEGGTTDGLTPGVDPGVYLWSGFDGWHLWVVNGEGIAGATGTITSNSDLQRGVASSPSDGEVTTDGKTITFDLSADSPVVGVDFDPGLAEQLEVEIEGPDGPIDASLVVTGTEGVPVDGLPLVLDKAEVSGS